MDCEFIENEFNYHQLRCQREKHDDDLRWLVSSWLSNLDPTDQVGNATESPQQDVLSTPLPLPILSDHHVSCTNHDNDVLKVLDNDNVIVDALTEEVVTDTVETGNHDGQNVDSESYVLPPRSTRVVPPRRYDLEYEAK